MSSLGFEILIDDFFSKINTDKSLHPIDNKSVLSIINDFENGKWRYEKFQNFIWNNIAETALSYQERGSLIGEPHTTLINAARNLRLSEGEIGKGSELAEIVLYGIMRHHYQALSVVPKIFYKQNSQDNAKGADSVHIVIEGDSDFSIWFGEAKFFTRIKDSRLNDVIKSVENSLNPKKIRKENSIITNICDLKHMVSNEQLREQIISVLNQRKSIDDLKPKLHIPILLLHECQDTNNANELTIDYKEKIIIQHKEKAELYFKKQITKIGGSVHKYEKISFHLILFPVPCKKIIVDKFVKKVEFFKNE